MSFLALTRILIANPRHQRVGQRGVGLHRNSFMHYRSLNDPSKPPYDFGIAKAIRPAVALALHAGQNGYGNYEWKLGNGRAFPEPGRFIREVRTMLLLREYVRRSLPENLAGT